MSEFALLAQAQTVAPPSDFLDRIPADQLTAVAITSVVFGTLLLCVITLSVTRTIRCVLIAGANARLAEKLAGQGMSAEQITEVVKANSRGRWFGPRCSRKRRGAWQVAAPPQAGVPSDKPGWSMPRAGQA